MDHPRLLTPCGRLLDQMTTDIIGDAKRLKELNKFYVEMSDCIDGFNNSENIFPDNPAGFNTPNPLSPIPPMKQSPFDFSAAAITFSQSSKSCIPFTSTPDILNIPISPIKHETFTDQQLNSSSDGVDVESLNSRMESLCYDDDEDDKIVAVGEDLFNATNINNRRLSVSTMLADLGLKQYEPLMKEMDLISFLMLTDDDLIVMGVTDPHHRELFRNAMKMFCEI